MINRNLVTIYIPCRNYGMYLSQSIESVLNQSYTNWELFIINEGSNDDTQDIAKEYELKYPNKIKLINNKKAIGLQKIANHILDISKGKYMIRLDADDWLDESAILLLVSKLESDFSIGLVYGNFYYVEESGNIIGVENKLKLDSKNYRYQLPPHGACTLFKTNLLKSAGGYSEDVNAQDGWDLWYKISSRASVANIQTPIFYYRQHSNSLSRDNQRLISARSKIFEKIASNNYDYKPRVLAVLPVKESYPDFEGIPYFEINTKSLLEIAINNALESEKVDILIVSSESQKVLDFSLMLEKTGKTPKHFRYLRRKSNESSTIPILDFMKSAAKYYNSIFNKLPDILLYLSLHAINRRSKHINEAINVLLSTHSNSVVSVEEEREPIFKYNKLGLDILNPGRFKGLSFDKERIYRFNGSLIATWWETVHDNSFLGKKTSFIEMTRKDSFQIKGKHFFQQKGDG